MSARKPTAKERTVPMPGVDLREQDNRTPAIVDSGPTYATVVGSVPFTKHIATSRTAQKALCGTSCHFSRYDLAGLKTVCQACRAEASKARARVLP